MQARQAALRIWRHLNRPEQVGHTLRWLSRLSWFLGHSSEAEKQDQLGRVHLERSLHLALERGLEEHVACAYTNLACCAVMNCEYPLAQRFLQEGLSYCVEHILDLGNVYGDLQARVRFEQGNWDDAAQEHPCSNGIDSLLPLKSQPW